jgi:hypothetical protein
MEFNCGQGPSSALSGTFSRFGGRRVIKVMPFSR